MIRDSIKRAVATALRKLLDAAPPVPVEEKPPAFVEVEEQDGKQDPYWAYMVPVPPLLDETPEQTIARARSMPGVTDVRRTIICPCGWVATLAVMRADISDEMAIAMVQNPKTLPGDIFLEFWDPLLMRVYDHENNQRSWLAHNKKMHVEGQAQGVFVPPSTGGKGGTSGGSSSVN